jgi:tetratricopeptide (TPR) repeat protein
VSSEIGDGEARARALTELADELTRVVDFAGALEAAEEAIAEATRAGDERQVLRATIFRILARVHVDPSYTQTQSPEELGRVRERLQEIADVEGTVRAAILGSALAFWDGRTAESFRILMELLERMPLARFWDRSMVALLIVAYAHTGSAPVAEALGLVEQVDRLIGGGLLGEARVREFRAGLFGLEGRADDARAEAARVSEIWAELGSSTAELEGIQILAETARLLGDLDQAERYLRRSVEGFDALGEIGYNSSHTAALAAVLCDQGRFDEAQTWATRSRELTVEDDFHAQAGWRMAQARVLSHRGEHEDATALANEAVPLLEPSDYLKSRAEGHEVHGMVLAAAGRADEARAAFDEALELFERKGVVPAIARVRERLATLG